MQPLLLSLALSLAFFSPVQADMQSAVDAPEWRESSNIEALFDRAGVEGTFVLYDVSADKLTGFNHLRAQQRMVPASTYKIPHTLIGLAAGAVSSVDEILPYGGQPQPFPAWEHDMPLRDAIALSAVPIYQTLARRIGLNAMQFHVDKLDYGNRHLGEHVDRFWLDGPLKISAIEQVQFLARLAASTLPYSKTQQAATRQIVAIERDDHTALYAKSGWQNAPDPGIGWWVGWIEKDDHIYSFALNIDIRTPQDAELRTTLAKAALSLLSIYPQR